MTDFYDLLKQSILDRGIKNAGDREEVYAQARRAVIKQLWDFRPPLAADEIDTRVGAYDTAVERIEADLQIVFANGKGAAAPARNGRAVTVRTREPQPATNGHDRTDTLAEWAREQPEYAPGVPRAPATYSPPPEEENEAEEEAAQEEYAEEPLAYEDEPYEEEEPPEYREEQPAYRDERPVRRQEQPANRDEDERREQAGGQRRIARPDRWSQPTALEARRRMPALPRPDWLGFLGTGDQLKVRLLAIAIGSLFVVLVGVGAYFLGSRSGDRSVTVPIGVRREVSDAATAARIPKDKVQVAQTFAVFDGRDPTVFSTTPDNPVRFDDANGFARVSSSTSASGVKVVIGPGLAARLAGHQVRIVITARSSIEAGAANMRFAYQSGLAISHWQTANLSQDYQELGLLWRLPTMRTSPAGDFLLIEPGIPGDGTGVDIQSIRIDILT